MPTHLPMASHIYIEFVFFFYFLLLFWMAEFVFINAMFIEPHAYIFVITFLNNSILTIVVTGQHCKTAIVLYALPYMLYR